MIIEVEHQGKLYQLDTEKFHDLSIPYNFNGPQPNYYDVETGQAVPLEEGGKKWSVAEGAGCNVMEVNFNVHCTGTHTECVGHLLNKESNVSANLKNLIVSAVLVTIKPQPFGDCPDQYHAEVGASEEVISADKFSREYKQWFMAEPEALIIRTEPNSKEKQFKNYSDHLAPFFTNGAMSMLGDTTIQHLIVDLPSVDRMDDGGILGNHRIFWGVGYDPHSEPDPLSRKTITEMAYIPNAIEDGFYFLTLQLPHFLLDAAPSRPILLKPV